MSVESTNKMYNQYKMLCTKHRLAQSKYEKQQSAFNEIIKCWTIRFLGINLRLIEWINQIDNLIKMEAEDAFILSRIVDKSNGYDTKKKVSDWGKSRLYMLWRS